jgi:hypothetical protein
MALPAIIKLSAFLITLPTNSASIEWSFSALKRVHTYLCRMQTQEGLTELSEMEIDKKILQDLEKGSHFCDSVTDIFMTKN